MTSPSPQKEAFQAFYDLARNNAVLDEKTTVMIHLASAMAVTAARMEATATLAGGIAHKVNNRMAIVMCSASILRGEKDREELKIIEDAAREAGELAHHMLAFARGGKWVNWATAYPLLKEINPALNVLICSGFGMEVAAKDLVKPGDGYVEKPVGGVRLCSEIHRLLDA